MTARRKRWSELKAGWKKRGGSGGVCVWRGTGVLLLLMMLMKMRLAVLFNDRSSAAMRA